MSSDSSSRPRRLIDGVLSGMDSTSGEPLDEDTVFDILSNRRRRQIIYYLQDNGGEAPLREVADAVAGWEEGQAPEEVTEKQSRRVYVSLYQSHVPRLTEVGLIEHDDSGAVRLTDRVRLLDPYLNPHTDTRSWQWYYLAFGVVGVVLALLSLLGFPPAGVISGANLLLVVSLGFVLLALAHVQRAGTPRDASERRQLDDE
jgi:small-conductance mechanosensitive channel